jgi:hypothetical protein
MIAQAPPENLTELAHKFFIDELGLSPNDIPEASRNIVSAFEVLYRIHERANKQQL